VIIKKTLPHISKCPMPWWRASTSFWRTTALENLFWLFYGDRLQWSKTWIGEWRIKPVRCHRRDLLEVWLKWGRWWSSNGGGDVG
jgi:hypothetical protein